MTAARYAINFTAPGAYQVTDRRDASVATGNYTDGDTIAFNGVQVTLSGTPAAGDSFSVAPSTNQSLFTTRAEPGECAANRRQSPRLATAQVNNSIDGAINNIDQALDQTSNVRATRRRPAQFHHHAAVGRGQPANPAASTPFHRCRAWTTRAPSPRWISKTRP